MKIRIDIITLVKLITLSYIFSGALSTILNNPMYAYAIIDLSLILCFFLAMKIDNLYQVLNLVYFKIKRFSHFIFLFLCIFCIIGFLNINEDVILKSLVGIRENLLPFLFIPFGVYLSKNLNKDQLIRSENFLKKIIFFLFLIIFLQFLHLNKYMNIQFIEIFNPSLGSIHSWYKDEINLYSSVFSSNKRAARFIFFSSIILVYIRKNLGLKTNLIILFSYISIVFTGSREAIILYSLFICYEKILIGKKYSLNLLIKILALVIALLVIINSSKKILNLDYIYSISQMNSYLERITAVYDPEILTKYNVPIHGYGPGSYGQISRISNYYDQLNNKTNFKRGFRDSYIAKIYFEYGIFFIFILTFIFITSLKIYFQKSKNDFHKVSKFMFFSWIAFLIKGHPVFSDIYISVFIAILVGSIANYPQIKKKLN